MKVRVTATRTNDPEKLTERELVDVTAVFRSLETGLREVIFSKIKINGI